MLVSLRALGYSFEAALADIVDNSVAAGATRVDVQFRQEPRPYVAVVDDGHGMSAAALLEAMRHGGVGPERNREAGDLGRFGLGLKTASLSQCRRLTVATMQSGAISAAAWDLDRVEATGDWVLLILEDSEISLVPHVKELVDRGHGTVVVWEEFDRATAGESSQSRALGELVDLGASHLALVFHRYLAGEGGAPLTIAVNQRQLDAVDPFLAGHPSTQQLPTESLQIQGATVMLRPFILPHLSRMSAADRALAGGEEGLRRNQGFYVYRNRRLITYGTWFRLIRQEELTKLARVQVDIPNALDRLWALDIKKSTAHPPEAAREVFRRVVERIAGASRQVHEFRGRRTATDGVTHIWDRLVIREGIEYRINRDHPLVALMHDLDEDRRLEQLLRAIEVSMPTDSLYADMAAERSVQSLGDEAAGAFLRDLAQRLVHALKADRADVDRLLDSLDRMEPFAAHPVATRGVVEEFRRDHR